MQYNLCSSYSLKSRQPMRCDASPPPPSTSTRTKKEKKKSTCNSPTQRLQNPRSSSLIRLDKIACASTQLRNCFSTDKPQVSFVHFPTWHCLCLCFCCCFPLGPVLQTDLETVCYLRHKKSPLWVIYTIDIVIAQVPQHHAIDSTS